MKKAIKLKKQSKYNKGVLGITCTVWSTVLDYSDENHSANSV